jgi:hypothetical protein
MDGAHRAFLLSLLGIGRASIVAAGSGSAIRAAAEGPHGLSAIASRAHPEASAGGPEDHVGMTYAVRWSENDGPEFAGRLSMEPAGVTLHGTAAGRPPASCDVRFAEIVDLYLERTAPPRHTWRPSLVLVTTAGDRVEIGSLQGLGALHELAEEVACGRGKTTS